VANWLVPACLDHGAPSRPLRGGGLGYTYQKGDTMPKITCFALCALILAGLPGCRLFVNTDQFEDQKFAVNAWKSMDTNSAANCRYRMLEDLTRNYLFYGVSDTVVLALLGTPAFDQSSGNRHRLEYNCGIPEVPFYFDQVVLDLSFTNGLLDGKGWGES
jgi:hypothetical protein